MTIRRIEPNKRLSAAVVHGNVVYISGQVPESPHVDVTTQTREILAKIDRLLREAGTDKSRLVNASVWLADIMTFEAMNAAWEAWLPPGQAPARATVEARIANPAYRVEIAVVAAIDP
jgi:enamine deaminase RidA (YjgF/YER057c/UK114 family)